MDINLPLILFLAVAGTGLVWLFDAVMLQRKRQVAIDALDDQFKSMTEEERDKDERYTQAKELVSTEPVLVEYSKSFFPVLLLVFVLRSFIVEPFQIPSESMVPTLEVGDFILVNKFTYGIRLPLIRTKVIDINEPSRGDVMVFFPPNETRYFIKRVIGLPGDTIRVRNNRLFINGEEMLQEYIRDDNRDGRGCPGTYELATEQLGEHAHVMRKCTISRSARDQVWEVPQGHYFMMGDNRDNSSDSRVWGPVPEERIVGKAFAIWMHWPTLLSIPKFSRVGGIE